MGDYLDTITNEAINELPLIEFSGTIHVITTPEELDDACRNLEGNYLLGFDTEAKPAFKKGVTHPISLLQLSNDEEAYLIRLLHTGITDSLKRLLENKQILKTGVAIEDDLKGLNKIRRFKPGGFLSLEKEVKKVGIENNGLRKLAGIILESRISKSAQVSNWEVQELTNKQKIYAATDAWIGFKMLDTLHKKHPDIFK